MFWLRGQNGVASRSLTEVIGVAVKQGNLSKKALTTLFKLDYPFKIRKNTFGEHFGSGGDWSHPTPNDSWRGIHAYYYCFPEDVVVTVFVNSGDSSPNIRVIRAYEQAFK